ncbi:MAG: M14 family metallopeptidase, partial [Myxococcales bacterium]|nr:M14 family metallopeptidase [Myxococcales bacterium]
AGEALATEVARFGPADAPNVLVIGSGTHGIEGFCGSGCQVALMRDEVVVRPPSGVAVLLVHAHNPHGFAWGRRVTEEGVDLNRNFIDFAQPLPANPGYGAIHGWLVPPRWAGPERDAAEAAIQAHIAEHGFAAWQQALTGGQHTHPDGLFFGGTAPTWSRRTLERILHDHVGHAKRVGFIDLHTGLGPTGYGEPIFPGGPDDPAHARARAWYGAAVTCPADGSSTSATVHGTLYEGFRRALPEAEITPIALEYGTVPIADMLLALRGDHWVHQYVDMTHPPCQELKARMRAAFYVETDAWKRAVVDRCVEVVGWALAALR